MIRILWRNFYKYTTVRAERFMRYSKLIRIESFLRFTEVTSLSLFSNVGTLIHLKWCKIPVLGRDFMGPDRKIYQLLTFDSWLSRTFDSSVRTFGPPSSVPCPLTVVGYISWLNRVYFNSLYVHQSRPRRHTGKSEVSIWFIKKVGIEPKVSNSVQIPLCDRLDSKEYSSVDTVMCDTCFDSKLFTNNLIK